MADKSDSGERQWYHGETCRVFIAENCNCKLGEIKRLEAQVASERESKHCITCISVLTANKALEAQVKELRQQAQIHAQEARTANATIAEIYQLCSGSAGEPGNWNGAEPVRRFIYAAEKELASLREQLAEEQQRQSFARGNVGVHWREEKDEKIRSLTEAMAIQQLSVDSYQSTMETIGRFLRIPHMPHVREIEERIKGIREANIALEEALGSAYRRLKQSDSSLAIGVAEDLHALLTHAPSASQAVQVAGTYMDRSIADFRRAVEVLLAEEQAQVSPNNALIAVLCDAVRLSRELALSQSEERLAQAHATEAELRSALRIIVDCGKRVGIHGLFLTATDIADRMHERIILSEESLREARALTELAVIARQLTEKELTERIASLEAEVAKYEHAAQIVGKELDASE